MNVPDTIKHFQSVSVDGNKIELFASEIDQNTIEIKVLNMNYKAHRNFVFKQLLICSLLLSGCVVAFNFPSLNIVIICYLLFRLYCLIGLVEFEKLTVVKDFGVQLTTTYSFGRRKCLFIQFIHLQDVIISEVFQNLRTTFMLALLTDGKWYKKKPLIPIMNVINPRLDILKIVYNILKHYIVK